MSNVMIFETPEHADMAIGMLEEMDNDFVYGIMPCDDGYAIHVAHNDVEVGCLTE